MLLKALILDDDVDVVTLVAEVLASNNFQAQGFSEPKEALTALGQQKFDVIIADLMLPEMDGFEFIYQVRQKGLGIPIIALTGLPDLGESIFTQKDGRHRQRPDVCLAKPFSYETFYQTFNSIADKLDFSA